ncbi:cadherin domain protein [Dictyocaulus viviparus]|uniref:Cadherin domain protein n=1 Tax=Dictyocaulus viviparus TaxID=29172 RepID=A0A0D8Y8Q3_DICVI|nr:cadherin domain protein [Dictyocaulus viviparus]
MLIDNGVFMLIMILVPVINLHGADRLVASIREDENVVTTVPDLSIVADTGPVCKYLLTSSDKEIPFDVQLTDQHIGSAIIRVKDGNNLDCTKSEYDLQVVAVRCGDETIRSEPVVLKVSVKDTNNHSPEFDNPWYSFTVNEGKIYDEIAVIKARDADCGNPYGQICDFEIANGLNDFPFSINNQGILRNIKPLNYSVAKSYILTVVAIDCGMRRSKSALITINVKETCIQGHTGFAERFNYVAGYGPRLIFPNVSTHICAQESECEVRSLRSAIKLNAGHVTNGCFRDTIFTNQTIQKCVLDSLPSKYYAKRFLNVVKFSTLAMNISKLRINIKLPNCKLSPDTIALLPSKTSFPEESSEAGMAFDGVSNVIIIPPGNVPAIIPDKFTLSFSMKHSRGTKDDQKNKKSILCESDEKGAIDMNRHHFSVYVRHCKLEVVLRREAGSKNEFRAAEWRWETPQICDNEWHSYSLLFNGVDDVNLMIDGSVFKSNERNPEILDDWPLHRTEPVVKNETRNWSVLARTSEYDGAVLQSGKTENHSAIECAHRCPEQLQYIGLDEIVNGQSITFSADQSTIVVKALTEQEISKMLRRISYVNSQKTPIPGHRSWTLSTTVECQNNKKLTLPQAKGYVFVQKETKPVLSLSGSVTLNVDQHAVKIGTPMISDIQISISQTEGEGEVKDVTSFYVLDYCKVHLKPSRDMDLEYFSSPASLIAALQIDFEHDKEGITLRGEESVNGYRDVLSKIHYFNTRPDTYSRRIYTVQCAMLKGQVLSNELMVPNPAVFLA